MSNPNHGRVLAGRYVLGRQLGSGGMGAVFAATDLRTGGRVAVKLLHPAQAGDRESVVRLRREAEMAAALTSPRVVRVIDLGEDADTGALFLVQEFVDGETLEAALRARGRYPVAEALALIGEVARALVAAHAAGIVHRDLKPSNVMLTDGHVKVLDFGLARDGGVGATVTATGVFLGTPAYSAPERMVDRGDIRADIYALGVILYELLAGRLPFDAPNPLALLRLHASAPPPPLPDDVPRPVQALVRRCLEKEPEDRYPTPDALLAALDAARSVTVGPPAAGVVPGEATGRDDVWPPSPPGEQGIASPPGPAAALMSHHPPADSRPPIAIAPGSLSAGPRGMDTPAPTLEVWPAPVGTAASRVARRHSLPLVLAGGGIAALLLLALAVVIGSRGEDGADVATRATATVPPSPTATSTAAPAGSPPPSPDPRALTAALATTAVDPRHVPEGMKAELPKAEAVSGADRERGVEGQVQIGYRETIDLFSNSVTFYVYASEQAARARFATGYRSGGTLSVTEQPPPAEVPMPATTLTGSSNQDGTRVGIAFCIVIAGNVEIRATAARAFPNDSGDPGKACAVARSAIAHLRRVQGGE